MKYFNKQFLISNKLIKILIILLFFFLGIFTERFDYKDKIISFGDSLITSLSNKIFLFYDEKEKLIININQENYQKILQSRKKSIEQYRASENLHKWVSANIIYNGELYEAKIKLKGVHKEHWSHSKKWSFKIKLIDGKTINGIKRFSVQKPATRNYLYEWVFMKTLQHEGLISHRNKYVETTVNGENLGTYYFEEMYTDELIKNNKRRVGPIIGLDKELWIKEANNLKNLGSNVLEDSFWRAKIKPIQFEKSKKGTEHELYLKEAISLFENFRDGNLKVNEVFEINQLAKLMSVKAIFGSIEFDWRDIKFYYNPITSLLEPIGREVHTSEKFNNDTIWWINNNFLEITKNEQSQFLNLLFKDENFYELFLFELNRMTKKNYIKNILDDNKDEFNRYKKILKFSNPTKSIFSETYLEKNRKYIFDTLNPIQGINSYYINIKKNQIYLSIRNIQSLPINIVGIKSEDKKIEINLKKPILISGKKYNLSPKNMIIQVPCEGSLSCKDIDKKKFSVIYRIQGQKNLKLSEVSQFYKIKSIQYKKKQTTDELLKLPFISLDKEKQEINFDKGEINIDQKIVIPENYLVNFQPGSKIIFSDEGIILSYSPLNIEGTEKNPVIFTSKRSNENNNFGYGISVINANRTSKIKNAIFKQLAYSDKMSGYGFSGSVNFFNSDVVIRNSRFLNNLNGDDYLSIVNSNFEIENVSFFDIKGDAIDFEYSVGKINDLLIQNASDDAIDFSGSNVSLNNITINSIGDKGISVGEKSDIKISNLKIKNASIGVASKDLSNLMINNLEITDSKVAILAYQRKIEYGPGIVNAQKVSVENNTVNYLSEKKSKIVIDNKIIDFTDMDYSIF